MVIECTTCQTRFRMGDDKLKPEGTKVRCSKCREIFTVFPPAAEPEEIDFGEFNMEPVPDRQDNLQLSAAAAGTAAIVPEDQTAVFENPPAAEAEPPAAEPGPASGPSPWAPEEENDFGTGGPVEFSFEEEPPDHFQPAPDSPTATSALDDFSFEEDLPAPASSPRDTGEEAFDQDDFSFEEDLPAPDSPPRETAESSADDLLTDTEDETFGAVDFSFEDDADQPFAFGEKTTETAPGQDEDFSWATDEAKGDFGFPSPPETPPAATTAAAVVAVSTRVPEKPVPARDAAPDVPDRATDRGDMAVPPPQAVPLPPLSPPRRRSPMAVLVALLIFLLLGLCGVAGYFFWQGGPVEIARLIDQLTGQAPPPPASGQIQVTNLASRFVRNREAGQLLVIDGEALNQFNQSRSAIAVKGVLFDKQGKVLLQQTVYCGNPVAQTVLTDLPFARIQEMMNNQFGDSLSNLNVAPGKTIPFTVVFRNVPAEVAEFAVEVTDSRPGTNK